jgi:MFS transporter, ACS family, tartrate transporter
VDELAGSGRMETDRAVVKAGWRILPLLGIGYLFAFMDRLNVSFAAPQMNADLGFSATVYGFGAGLFFLAYGLLEIPSNLLLLRFGARRWLALLLVASGLIAAGTMFVRTPVEFYVLRFLLGVAQGGYFPGVIYFLSTWFPSEQRGKAIGLFFVANPLSIAVMGQLSGWLLGLDGAGGLRGWQWLFLLQGLPAALIGAMVLLWLPETPATAPWLSVAERSGLEAALGRHPSGAAPQSSDQTFAVLRNPTLWLLAAVYVLTVSALTTLLLSAPAILTELSGKSIDWAGALVSAGGLLGALAMVGTGWFTDRRGERFTALFAAIALALAGLLTFALAEFAAVVAVAFLLVLFARGIAGTAQCAIWTDVFTRRELAVGTAAIVMASQFGSFLGPFAFGAARDVTGSYTAGLLVLPAAFAMALVLTTVLWRRLNAQMVAQLI